MLFHFSDTPISHNLSHFYVSENILGEKQVMQTVTVSCFMFDQFDRSFVSLDIICMKWRSSCDYANSDTPNGPSALHAAPITARSTPLHRK